IRSMAMRRRSTRLGSVARVAALVGGLAAALKLVESQRAFVAPLTEDVTSASAQTRRSLLATVGIAGFGPAWAPQAFGAEAAAEAPKVKKERPPENLIVDGREGSNKNVNGRWTIVFGKKLNGKAVYKKDGETLYLLNNACDEFQIDTVASKTECTGLAVKKNGVWVFGGKEDPNVKVRTAAPGETYAVVKVDIEAILRG
ncbi:unnamed protein product, partial [Polarella glacialis]